MRIATVYCLYLGGEFHGVYGSLEAVRERVARSSYHAQTQSVAITSRRELENLIEGEVSDADWHALTAGSVADLGFIAPH